ncbi:MAG: hypothetical protein NWE98_08145 [Candidatus Bathyarchaeota archaeon]|nr:hypothetical protein [Candidatus Bathyarchaeota archaeon]
MLQLDIVQSMPTLDLAMPTALLVVVLVAIFLNKRAEGRLVASVEQREFRTRDVILLIVFIAIVISVIAYTSMFSPLDVVPNILMVVFLASYTMLLFTFSHIFSDLTRKRAQLLSTGFGTASLIVAVVSLSGPLSDGYSLFRAIAFFALSVLCFTIVAYEKRKIISKARWYLAAQPPAMFVLLFVFFNVMYGGAVSVWFPILMDIFGFTFAILIILYLSSLFSWKTVGIFAVMLTFMDVFLVFTGPMVTAAQTFTGLGLPVLIYLPNIPIVYAQSGGIGFRGLGLGDFFFAGILAVQTYNKFGRKTGVISAVTMALAFGIWEAFLPEITSFFEIGGFPATVCIICGWIPIVAWKFITTKNKPSTTMPISQPEMHPNNNVPLQ